MTEKKVYKNPNGYLSIKEMVKLKKENKLEEYCKNFKIINNKCPAKELINNNTMCFYCQNCIKTAFNKIKIFKNYYKLGNRKYGYEESGNDKKRSDAMG